MEIAIAGLGRMGANMARRLKRAGHNVVAFNRTAETTRRLAGEEGLIGAFSPADVRARLAPPRTVWLMLPAGPPTEEHIEVFGDLLEPGDCIVNGANDFYKDDIRYAAVLAKRGIAFVDAGVSGGIWGLQ